MIKFKIIFTTICILIITTLSGCRFDKDSQEIRKLEEKIKQGNAIFSDYESLGEIYFKQERYEDTIKCMTSLLEKYNKSKPVIKRAFKEYSIDAYRLRGKSKYLLGQKEEAEEDLTSGNYMSYGYYQLGELFFQKKKYPEVIECMNRVIKINKNEKNYGAHSYRGRALYLLGETEAGTQDLFKAGGWPHDLAFMREHGIEWVGKEREEFDRKARQMSDYKTRTNKNFTGRDQVFNALRDGIEDSNMSWADKQKAKVKLHDDMYKE